LLWCPYVDRQERRDDVRAIFAVALTGVAQRSAQRDAGSAEAVLDVLRRYTTHGLFARVKYAVLACAGRLGELAEVDAVGAFDLVELLIEQELAASHAYLPYEEVARPLRAALQCGNPSVRQRAERLVHRLVSVGISILVACWRLIESSYTIHEDRDAPHVASCGRLTKPVPPGLGASLIGRTGSMIPSRSACQTSQRRVE
jgi:hypothetical protein